MAATADRAVRAFNERMDVIISRFQREADTRVARRGSIENQWIADLEQYHGRYSQAVMKDIQRAGGSQLFVPMTRPKTNAVAARLMDLLFPTEDRNWSIEPTPVPLTAAGVAVSPEELALVREAARLMSAEIDDQLTECDYQAQCRDVIEDACKIGTGIMEGPIAPGKMRRGWSKQKNGTYKLGFTDETRPGFYRVDPWSFFPDPDARTIQESEEGVYVRYLWKAKELREFARMDGVHAANVAAILREKSYTPAPAYLSSIRRLTGETVDLPRELYHVWKFTGSITGEVMMDLAMAMDDDRTYNEAEEDPLAERKCVLWFCQGRLLKFSIHPLDSEEITYSVFNLEKDEATIWGYGVPRMIRDPQAALNGAWRMLMDNGALSTGDQIIINRRHVQPIDGDWKLTPRKIWELTADAETSDIDIQTVFGNFAINSHLAEIIPMIELCYKQIDDGSGVPQVAQGQPDGSEPTATPVGTEVLRATAANIVFRRFVKNWDVDMTMCNLRRIYDWNMQFSERDEIKGDFNVKARGSSVLLVREMQAANLTVLALQFGQSPIFGKYQKNVEVLREVYRAHMLDPTLYVVNDAEAKAADDREQEMLAAAAAAEGTGPDPEIEKAKIELERERLQQQTAVAEMETDARMRVAEIQHETAMMGVAEKLNMSREQIEAMLLKADKDRASKERSMAAEIAIRASQQSPLNETQIANE